MTNHGSPTKSSAVMQYPEILLGTSNNGAGCCPSKTFGGVLACNSPAMPSSPLATPADFQICNSPASSSIQQGDFGKFVTIASSPVRSPPEMRTTQPNSANKSGLFSQNSPVKVTSDVARPGQQPGFVASLQKASSATGVAYSQHIDKVQSTPLNAKGLTRKGKFLRSAPSDLRRSARTNFISSADGVSAGDEDMLQKAMRRAARRNLDGKTVGDSGSPRLPSNPSPLPPGMPNSLSRISFSSMSNDYCFRNLKTLGFTLGKTL